MHFSSCFKRYHAATSARMDDQASVYQTGTKLSCGIDGSRHYLAFSDGANDWSAQVHSSKVKSIPAREFCRFHRVSRRTMQIQLCQFRCSHVDVMCIYVAVLAHVIHVPNINVPHRHQLHFFSKLAHSGATASMQVRRELAVVLR
jgi:hypothetical protein